MNLAPEDADLFFKLMWAVQFYVNGRLKLIFKPKLLACSRPAPSWLKPQRTTRIIWTNYTNWRDEPSPRSISLPPPWIEPSENGRPDGHI